MARPVSTRTRLRNGQYSLLLAIGLVAVWLPAAAPLAAQDRAAAGPDADDSDVAPLDLALHDTVIVTASRTAERRPAVMASHVVVTESDIRTLGAASVADVLRQAPGLQIATTGREGSLASLFVRGGESDYNHVLIDGVRVNADGGTYSFSRISATEIERMEVVRGAQSALYGSDAIGSVIQIFTRQGELDGAPRVVGSFERGSFDTARADLRLLGGARQRMAYQVGAALRTTEGAFADRLREPDRFDQHSVDGNVRALLGAGARLRGGVRYSNARGTAVGPIAFAPGDTGTRADSDDLTWHLTFDQQLTPRIDHAASASGFRSGRQADDLQTDPPYHVRAVLAGEPGARFPASPRLVRLLDPSEFDALAADPSRLPAGHFLAHTPYGLRDWPGTFNKQFRRGAARYQVNAVWFDEQQFSAGWDYTRESNALAVYERIGNHSYFVQQQFALSGAWFVTAGARADANALYGWSVNPKLSAGGYPVPFSEGPVSSVKLFANVGRGIKNPTFAQLYGSPFVDGDRLLQPEQAVTLDAGAEFTFDNQRWLARITWFNNEYADQIAYRPSAGFGGDGVADYINIDGSKADGVELEMSLERPVGGLTAAAHYALVDTEVVTSASTSEQFQPGQPLLRRPRHAAGVRVGYVRGRSSLHLNVQVVGQRHDSAFLGLVRVSDGRPADITVNPAYTLVTLGGQFRVREHLTLFARADNLTGAEYATALGYPGLPRAVAVGARFGFGR